jgi:hypothetical protein
MTGFVKAATALFVAILLCDSPAHADFVFLTCGASAGSTYYMEGGTVSAADAGWQKDGIDENTVERCTPPANWANTKLATERYKARVGNTDDRSTQAKTEW